MTSRGINALATESLGKACVGARTGLYVTLGLGFSGQVAHSPLDPRGETRHYCMPSRSHVDTFPCLTLLYSTNLFIFD